MMIKTIKGNNDNDETNGDGVKWRVSSNVIFHWVIPCLHRRFWQASVIQIQNQINLTPIIFHLTSLPQLMAPFDGSIVRYQVYGCYFSFLSLHFIFFSWFCCCCFFFFPSLLFHDLSQLLDWFIFDPIVLLSIGR